MGDANELIGRTVAGKYALRKLIGEGGMGAVYEGLHMELGKRVAVKIISKGQGPLAETSARFRREARAASAVESEHIVQVFDVGEDPEFGLYMVMELLSGEDLSTRLERETRLDVGTWAVVASQAARGLGKAHAAGVIHRDLKPANIFLVPREDGTLLVKVLDFGISRLLREEVNEPQDSRLTRVGAVIGTPQYMSPEQAQGLPGVDHRTDIWALGAVLYECIAGRPPYPDMATYEQTIIAIVTKPVPPLEEIAPWVPPSVARLLHDALAHDAKARIPDCVVFLRRLIEALPIVMPEPANGSRPSHLALAPHMGGPAQPAFGPPGVLAGGTLAFGPPVVLTKGPSSTTAVMTPTEPGPEGLPPGVARLQDVTELDESVLPRSRARYAIATLAILGLTLAGGTFVARSRSARAAPRAGLVVEAEAADPRQRSHDGTPAAADPATPKDIAPPVAPAAPVAPVTAAAASAASTASSTGRREPAPSSSSPRASAPAARVATPPKHPSTKPEPAKPEESASPFGGVQVSDQY